MADIQPKDNGGGKGKQKKLTLRVDFTPMVDMNMLLITFFMLASSMVKPQTMELSMPTKDKVKETEQNEVKASQAFTMLLGPNSKVYYFTGEANLKDPNFLKKTDFSKDGVRKILLARNREVTAKINELKRKKRNLEITSEEYDTQASELKKGKKTPVVIIKPSDDATYRDMVDALDEMQICNIGKYAIVPFDKNDKTMFDNSGIPVTFKE